MLIDFRERGEGRERERETFTRERNINWMPLVHSPDWGLTPQLRHVP